MKRHEGPYIDIGHSSLKVLLGGRGLEVPLERLPGGELTEASREALRREVRAFLGPGRPQRALCALPAQGVTLRLLSIPSASREEMVKILSLQMEKEFPLPADQLAWGYQLDGPEGTAAAAPHPAAPGGGRGSNGDGRSSGNGAARNGKAAPREVMVAAVRREVLEEYSRVLAGCGLRPLFSPGALAASSLCPRAPGLSSVLDIGRTHSELLNLEDGRPSSLRSLSWGGEAIDREIARALGVGPADAEEIKISFKAGGEAGSADPRLRAVEEAMRSAIKPLLKLLRESWPSTRSSPPRQVFVLGGGSRPGVLVRELALGLGEGFSLKPVEVEGGPGRSGPILGLRRSDRGGDAAGSLVLDHREKANGWARAIPGTSLRRWIGAAVLLAAASLILRYQGPAFRARGLDERLAKVRESFQAVPRVDRELGFLTHLQSSQMPFLDVLAVMASSSPRGARISSFTLNRRGEATIQGALTNFQEINEFRGKLIGSRWFAQVVIQEQSPSKDKSRLEFHITAQLRPGPSGAWPALELPPIPPDPEPSDDGPGPEEVAEAPPAPPPEPGPPGGPPAAAPAGSPAVGEPVPAAVPPGMAMKRTARSMKLRAGSAAPDGSTAPPPPEPPPQSVPQEGQVQTLEGEGMEIHFEDIEAVKEGGK